MEGVGLTVLGFTFIERVEKLFRWPFHARPLPVVERGVRCPIHDHQAVVSIKTDPDARSREQYVDVIGCSLLSDAAIGLPARRAYLPDAPACSVLVDAAATHPVYASGVSCRQPCRFVLNVAASAVPPPPLACASGVCDAIELMRQADPKFADTRLLFYSAV
jgi:hypothetical protein